MKKLEATLKRFSRSKAGEMMKKAPRGFSKLNIFQGWFALKFHFEDISGKSIISVSTALLADYRLEKETFFVSYARSWWLWELGMHEYADPVELWAMHSTTRRVFVDRAENGPSRVSLLNIGFCSKTHQQRRTHDNSWKRLKTQSPTF